MTPEKIAELIRSLPGADPDIPEQPREEDVGAWRRRIDAIDRVVLALLNERARCAGVIGHIKKRLGLPVYVPEREAEVLANVRARNPGPLPDHAVQHLFERIIDETRSLERRQVQGESDPEDGRTGA
jgi:chorismate mutase